MKRVMKASRWNDILIAMEPDWKREQDNPQPEQPKMPVPERLVATTAEGTRLMAFIR